MGTTVLQKLVLILAFACGAAAQEAVPAPAPDANAVIDKRVFGVLPNYRTADGLVPFRPIDTKMKVTIAAKDSFDWAAATARRRIRRAFAG